LGGQIYSISSTVNTYWELNKQAKHFHVQVPGSYIELSQQEGFVPNTNATITGQARIVYSRLSVQGSYTLVPHLIAQFTGFSNYYSQINQQNLSANWFW
jgi:hypothetical protein